MASQLNRCRHEVRNLGVRHAPPRDQSPRPVRDRHRSRSGPGGAAGPDRPSRIMVFEGGARFVGGTLDVGIKAGDAAVIGGTDTLTATVERAVPDPFVRWCRSRDYREQRLAAPYYVSPKMTGYEELDAYGSWREVPDYGRIWLPRAVPTGWAPYRQGHWVWLDPWGWTWVDNEPWGFAPFHYGRWAFIDERWA